MKQKIPIVNNNPLSPKGKIHRMSYFLAMTSAGIVIALINYNIAEGNTAYAMRYFALALKNPVFFLFSLPFWYIFFCATIKRLRDLKWSPWLSLLNIVHFPILDIILFFCLYIPLLGRRSQWKD